MGFTWYSLTDQIDWHQSDGTVLYTPAACIYHVHTESWAQVRHRFHREGIAGRWTAVRISPGRESVWADRRGAAG